ncbi:hypothetical protein MKW98_027050 [Papaver atlanticum]|uniref:RNA-binding protein 48 n=1 Tax=Papaver atlanticum TaxID=357466 RepID=A0AAD4RWV8_9MAGN|nr:hypothetical protein MKW98_027050 [Papaver atlanticum]
MPRNRDEAPAVKVYTVCDESRYLIVRNVPSLGCEDELGKAFQSYGEIEECKPMYEEDCEPYTDVYWIKFVRVDNARFAKRKLDESVFLGNRLQVSYAPQFESVSDTKEKLECRRGEVLKRLNAANSSGSKPHNPDYLNEPPTLPSPAQTSISSHANTRQRDFTKSDHTFHTANPPIRTVSSNEEYFPSPSMNATVQLVREKLDKIQSRSAHVEAGSALKKTRVDNRRRI